MEKYWQMCRIFVQLNEVWPLSNAIHYYKDVFGSFFLLKKRSDERENFIGELALKHQKVQKSKIITIVNIYIYQLIIVLNCIIS